MARHRQLAHAPVREALIDIQFEAPVPLELIDRFVASLGGAYAKKSDIWEALFGLNGGDGTTFGTRSSSAVGRRLEAAEGRPYVLQCRNSGFTVSRLSPYGQWSELRAEARRLFELFVQQVGVPVVSRIAVRYINEITLPLPIANFSEYLSCPPKVPDALPQGITGFLTRLIIPDLDRDCVSVVTQALEAPPNEGPSGASITVLLDIDVFRSTRVPASADDVWQTLDVLRDQKNRMFFEHLTERTVEKYE